LIVKKIVLLVIFSTLILAGFVSGEEKTPWIPGPDERAERPWIPGPDEVLIARTGVSMPLGRILLVRKGLEYCALKFTNTWLGDTKYDHYTAYEFYYQGDGSEDFSKDNVESGAGELFFPRVRSWMGIPYTKGRKDVIRCGRIKTKWFYIASMDFGNNELAPTPWTSITQVNVHDPRIQWYREDNKRKKRTIHIDRLWDDREDVSK
jgi:hypothetical protein